MNKDDFLKTIKSLCDGKQMPDLSLLEKGKLPEGWEESYLELLEDNRLYWQNLDSWPRELTYYFYRVAFHHQHAYSEWNKKNGSNVETENSLNKIRLFTESFIFGKPNDKWDTNT